MIGGNAKVMLTKSNDFEGEIEYLKNLLNKYSWAADAAKWGISSDGNNLLYCRDMPVYNPSLFPKISCIYKFINEDEIYFKNESEMEEDEDDDWDEEIVEEYLLHDICSDISKSFIKGFIELNFTEMDGADSSVQILKINSDGSGFRSNKTTLDEELVIDFEESTHENNLIII